MADEKTVDTFILKRAILSFPFLFKPRVKVLKAGDTPKEPKYEASFVFASDDRPQLTALKAACQAILMAKTGLTAEMVAEKVAAGAFNWPFKKVTDEAGYPKGGEIVKGCSSKSKPGTVSRWAEPGTTSPIKITDAEKFYPGCRVHVSLRPYYYDARKVSGKQGIGFNLNNLQLLDDEPAMPRLDNKVAAEDEFDAAPAATAELATPAASSTANTLLD